MRTAGWDVRELDGLSMRCAELLEYGGGGSGTGLGWHWDVGSTLTLVAMLNTQMVQMQNIAGEGFDRSMEPSAWTG